jgi:hypothetical protein
MPEDDLAAEVQDLPTYVMRQIAPDIRAEDRILAAHILTSLDEDGLLPITLVEIARYHHVPISRVEAVQRIIQRADPAGRPHHRMPCSSVDVLAGSTIHPLAVIAVQNGMNISAAASS